MRRDPQPTKASDYADRRALSFLEGEIEVRGEEALANQLGQAWESAQRTDPYDGVHGFHSWPGRMHPSIARAVLPLIAEPGSVIVDPFAGSHTVTVEAARLGAPSVGSDLNPLSAYVGQAKIQNLRGNDLHEFLQQVHMIVERSTERIQDRVRIRATLPPPMLRLYEGHTLMELAGLLTEIKASKSRWEPVLLAIFSAISTKFSQKLADSSEEVVVKRIRKGLPTEFFERKATELCRKWSETFKTPIAATAVPRLLTKSFSDLRSPEGGKVSVMTSPPYFGIFDYKDHHALRMAWLGLSLDETARHEFGSRREAAQRPQKTATDYRKHLSDLMTQIGLLQHKRGQTALVIGNSTIPGAGDALTELLALEGLGFEIRAAASLVRTKKQSVYVESPLEPERFSAAEHIAVLRWKK